MKSPAAVSTSPRYLVYGVAAPLLFGLHRVDGSDVDLATMRHRLPVARGSANGVDARQLVRLANGRTRLYDQVAQLRYTNSPPHHHWHLMRFDSFALTTLG